MDLKTLVELVVLGATLVAAWVAMRMQLAALEKAFGAVTESVDELKAAGAGRAQATAEALHRRIDDHERDIAVLKANAQHHAKQLEDGLNRIEASVALLHRRLDGVLGAGRSGA